MPDNPQIPANPFHDSDPMETREWLESIDSVLRTQGPERAAFLLNRITDRARRSGAHMAYAANTAYLNTIDRADQPEYPGDVALERRIENYIRWNAMAMVVHANRKSSEYGGHIATYASAATLYEVGFNHFWRAPAKENRGDLVYFQGHSSPGIYARAFMEGRLTREQLARFRQEVGGGGLSSYPHPWLMSDFWQFPTVSMGLGAMMAIFQARFMRYLEHRGLAEMGGRRVWCMLGDGEMDEPESLGAITVPVREGLDNLIFVINCNLQRLDGPVRGNGKIIQELEAAFLGAGWNVIKSIWGSRWDPLLARDHNGLLRRRMEECVDGEYQNCKALGGEYTREKFFGAIDGLKDQVSHMSTEDIELLNRGGHDRVKIYAAYEEAMRQQGRPTVILAKTVKGFGMGEGGESRMTAHQAKKLDLAALREFRDRFNIPVSDEALKRGEIPFRTPDEDSEEIRYLKERRRRLGGYLPRRLTKAPRLKAPALSNFKSITGGSGTRAISTTMALVRMLQMLTRDKAIGKHVVPIVPDEARTFGMEGMFKQLGIYSSVGQLYAPHDSEQLMGYREDIQGQILEEGINEAGSFCSWLAAGTSYSTHGLPMIPFYIFYSMFGFQRIGDFIWAGGDSQARGFLIGGTSGRTTLAGEGLQHQDGHSHLAAATVPQLPVVRPGVRLRTRRDHPGRAAAHGRESGERLLLHHHDERQLPPAAHAPGLARRHSQGNLPAARGRGGRLRGRAGPAVRLGRHSQRGGGRGRPAAQRIRRGGGRVVRHQLQPAAPRRPGLRALQPHEPRQGAAPPVPGGSAGRCLRALHCRQRLHGGLAGLDPAVGAGRVHHAGHRRIRAQRRSGRVAQSLRGGCALHRGRRAVGAGRGGADRARQGVRGDEEMGYRSRKGRSGYLVIDEDRR